MIVTGALSEPRTTSPSGPALASIRLVGLVRPGLPQSMMGENASELPAHGEGRA